MSTEISNRDDAQLLELRGLSDDKLVTWLNDKFSELVHNFGALALGWGETKRRGLSVRLPIRSLEGIFDRIAARHLLPEVATAFIAVGRDDRVLKLSKLSLDDQARIVGEDCSLPVVVRGLNGVKLNEDGQPDFRMVRPVDMSKEEFALVFGGSEIRTPERQARYLASLQPVVDKTDASVEEQLASWPLSVNPAQHRKLERALKRSGKSRFEFCQDLLKSAGIE